MSSKFNASERLSPAVQSIAPSGIRKFFDIAAKMQDVISLGVGEPDFVTPWSIRESCVYGLERGYTSYTANRGMPELRQEISNFFVRRHGVEYNPDTDFVATRLSTIDGVTQTRSHFLLKAYKKDGVILQDKEQDRRLVVSP